MAFRLALMWLAVFAAGCGGGGNPGADDSPVAAAPLIRFAAVYEGKPASGASARLTIRPTEESSSIGSNPIARVEVSTNNEPPQVLTAANGSSGNEYVFTVPDYDSNSGFLRVCREYPFKVTVTDSSGFALTKFDLFCPDWQYWSTGAFSDRGDRKVTLRVHSAQAARIEFRRYGPAYGDASMLRADRFEQALAAQAGDSVWLNAGIDPSAPAGTTATVRIDADEGSFVQADPVANGQAGGSAVLFMLCCRSRQPAGATSSIILGVAASYDAPEPPIWEAHYQVVDASGAVLRREDVTGSGVREWTVEIGAGQWIEMQAASRTPQATVDASAKLRPVPGETTTLARANGPAVRLRIR